MANTVAMLVTSIYNRTATHPSATDSKPKDWDATGTANVKGNPIPWGPGAHLDCGIFGTTFAFETMHHYGHDAAAWDVISQTTYPSFGYMTEQGATTLWEGWDGTAHTISFEGTSRNHIMFGGGVNRFIAAALGLTMASLPGATSVADMGWRRLVVHPTPAAVRALGQGKVSRRTPQGTASVSWRRHQRPVHLELNVTVPSHAVADVRVPLLLPGPVVALMAHRLHFYVNGCAFVHLFGSNDEVNGAVLTEVGSRPAASCDSSYGSSLLQPSLLLRPDGELVVALEFGPGKYRVLATITNGTLS